MRGRILFVCSEAPFPARNGVSIASSQVIEALSCDYLIDVLYLGDKSSTKPDGVESYTGVRRGSPSPMRWIALLKGEPLFCSRYRSAELKAAIARIISEKRYDYVHLDGIGMAQYVKLLKPPIQSIVSINDCYSIALEDEARYRNKGVRRIILQIYSMIVKQYERTIMPRAAAVKVVSPVDGRRASALGARKIIVTPPGVDVSSFAKMASPGRPHGPMFLGNLAGGNEYELKQFIRNVWRPSFATHGVALCVFGSGASPEFAAWLKSEATVRYIGQIRDVADAYCSSTVAVVPMRKSCGVLNKSLEAMAAGLAVCGYEESFLGIRGVRNGKEYLGATSDDIFKANIAACINSQKLAEQIGAASARAIAKNHDKMVLMQEVSLAYKKI